MRCKVNICSSCQELSLKSVCKALSSYSTGIFAKDRDIEAFTGNLIAISCFNSETLFIYLFFAEGRNSQLVSKKYLSNWLFILRERLKAQ